MQNLDEELLSIAEFSELIGFSQSKVRRMIRNGTEAIDGRVVKMDHLYTESGLKVTPGAYKKFLLQLNTREQNDQD